MKWKVTIIEDNELFRQALVNIISESNEFEVANIYSCAEDALNIIYSPPDLAIVDIHLPGINGIELIAKIRQKTKIECLVCSMHDNDEYIFKALENGASGYILKDASVDQIINSLTEIINGGAPMSPYIAKKVITSFKKPNSTEEKSPLTKRETEIISLLSEGLQYKEIASQLQISTETVKKHMRNIYSKLEVQNKVEAINKSKFTIR
jgi:NarL family two-component system response regulator LiaR